jgi:hypothetical protein
MSGHELLTAPISTYIAFPATWRASTGGCDTE